MLSRWIVGCAAAALLAGGAAAQPSRILTPPPKIDPVLQQYVKVDAPAVVLRHVLREEK